MISELSWLNSFDTIVQSFGASVLKRQVAFKSG